MYLTAVIYERVRTRPTGKGGNLIQELLSSLAEHTGVTSASLCISGYDRPFHVLALLRTSDLRNNESNFLTFKTKDLTVLTVV